MNNVGSSDNSALTAKVERRLEKIGSADIIVGIPSYRSGRTIAEVIDAVMRGIATYLPGWRVVLVNADGGSSDNTTEQIAEVHAPPGVEKLLYVYRGQIGKGMGIHSIFEVAARLHARACVIIEAHAQGIVPEWIPALVNPVLAGDDLTMGCYQRSSYGAALGDNLVYPFLRAFFNADVREPLASEFCVSGELAADLLACDVWETDVARFGVNVWIGIQALAENRRISQVDLGYRGESGTEPGTPLDARFLHAIGTMFRLLTTHRRLWEKAPIGKHIPFEGGRCQQNKPIPCQDCLGALVGAMRDGQERYGEEWKKTLSPETLQGVLALFEQPLENFDFPIDLWTRVVLELAVLHNKGEGDPDKVVRSLLPLFCGRAGAYVRQTQTLTPAEREMVVEQIVQAFADAKPLFLAKWNAYQSWLTENSTYWLR